MTEQKDREDLIFSAKLSEQCDRYDEMRDLMKAVTKMNMGTEPGREERNLFAVAYKGCIGMRRAAYQTLKQAEQRLLDNKKIGDGTITLRVVNDYRFSLEKETKEIALELLHLVDEYCMPFCSSADSKTFYFKLMADYYRYLSEICNDIEYKENALTAYKSANDIAFQELRATDPTRLSLALNFSIFYYEILESPDRACRLAKSAFDEAIIELDKLQEHDYKESTLIMQILRKNLAIWTTSRHPDATDSEDTADESSFRILNSITVPAEPVEAEIKEIPIQHTENEESQA